MRKLNPVVLVGALLAVVGVAVLVGVASGSDDNNEPGTTMVKAVVARSAVAPGAAADPAALEVRDVPAAQVPAGAPTQVAALQGQVALRAIAAGEVIGVGAFGPQGVAVAGGVTLPKGREAIGIELSFPAGALRYVVPQDKVTIWATRKSGAGGTRPILQKILVIATTPGSGTGEPTATVPGPGNLDFLLAVTRSEAALLIAAQARGDALYVTLSDTSS